MTYIPDDLRQMTRQRADYRCEYCYLHEDDSLYRHEIDHIIPLKHRGTTEANNLCLACLECNRYKGSDFASFDVETDEIIRLFHPRRDDWHNHFTLDNARVVSLSAIGRVTVFVLQINPPDRLRVRQALVESGRYPPG